MRFPRSAYEIPAELAQQMIARSDLSLSEVARRMGFTRKGRRYKTMPEGDTAKLKRFVGLLPERKGIYVSHKSAVTYDQAAQVCRAVDADPVDYGL